jgi:hypothetical protein
MLRRLFPLVVPVAVLLGACSPSPDGPARPLAPDQVVAVDGLKAAGAREAAMRFVRAYAAAADDDAEALGALVGTPLLQKWVHWLRVQNQEFPGTISGSVLQGEVGPAVPFSIESVPGSDEILRQVDVRASVTFENLPNDGQPFSVTRSLDGPMRLIQDRDGLWHVADFTRDGIPLSRSFEMPEDVVALVEGVRVSLDSFLSVPYWQFGLVVTSQGPIHLTVEGTTLVNGSGAEVRADAVSASLERVPASGTVEGLVTFPAQPSASGVSLRIRVARPGDAALVLQMPLEGVIDPVPTAPASPSAG